MTPVEKRLRHVLAGQRFPARRWELICAAEQYGADVTTRTALHDLPEGCYESVRRVIDAVERQVVA